MKLTQLRSVRAVASLGFSITRTAEQLNATQPGISRHLIDVETALGVDLFVREKNRLIGLTSAGVALMPVVGKVLDLVDDLHRVARQFSAGYRGSITLATSQTHARYLLPQVIERFLAQFPMVDLRLRHGHLSQIAEWVTSGEADLSVSAAPADGFPDLVLYPYGELRRVVVVPPEHPLLALSNPSLEDIARWPIITYERQFSAHAQILGAFEREKLSPRFAMTTSDTDIMKTYVRCGLGVAIVADPAFDPAIDTELRTIDTRHLFPPTRMFVGVRRDRPLTTHTLSLIEMIAPELILKMNSGTPNRLHDTD